MVVGNLPFIADTMQMLSFAVRVSEPEYPETMTQSIRTLLISMLQKDPEERPTIDKIKMSRWLLERPRLHSFITNRESSSAKNSGKSSPHQSLDPSESNSIVDRLVATGRFKRVPRPRESTDDQVSVVQRMKSLSHIEIGRRNSIPSSPPRPLLPNT